MTPFGLFIIGTATGVFLTICGFVALVAIAEKLDR